MARQAEALVAGADLAGTRTRRVKRALAAPWPDVPAQRCAVRKRRNLLAHAPGALHGQVSAGHADMTHAGTAKQGQARRRAFPRKRRLRCPAVAASLEAAGDRLFACLRLPPSQWKSARTTNAAERLHKEFKRRIKTQAALPCAEAAMLFWALLASGPAASASRFRGIAMRKANGWQTPGGTLAAAASVGLAA